VDARRLLTARAVGGLALLVAALTVAVGGLGFADAAAGSSAYRVLLPVAFAVFLAATVLWWGQTASGARRTPYW